jgi:hypothetical protein
VIRSWRRSATGWVVGVGEGRGRGGDGRPLSWRTYSWSTTRRCRWLTISMRSVSSAGTVRMHRSAKQSARGHRGAILTLWIPPRREQRQGGGELAGPVAEEESDLGEVIAQVPHEVTDLWGGLWAVGMGGRAQQRYRSAEHLHDEEHQDPLERHRGSPRGRSHRPTGSTPACAETAPRSCRCLGPVPAGSVTAAGHSRSWTLPRDGQA